MRFEKKSNLCSKKFLSARAVYLIKLFLSLAVFAFALVASLAFGAAKATSVIVITLRLPRSVLLVISGALLGGSGKVFQMFFQNDIADPALTGVSAAASLGIAVSISFFSMRFLTATTFLFCVLSTVILLLVTARKDNNSSTVLLCGAALSGLYASITSVISVTKAQSLYGLYTLLLGSVAGKGIKELKLVALPAVFAAVALVLVARKLDLFISGKKVAQTLGARHLTFLCVAVVAVTSLSVALSTISTGILGFVGLVTPALTRRVFGFCHNKGAKQTLLCFLFGATLLLLSDTLARVVIRPMELPTGVITAILGTPFFIALALQSGAKTLPPTALLKALQTKAEKKARTQTVFDFTKSFDSEGTKASEKEFPESTLKDFVKGAIKDTIKEENKNNLTPPLFNDGENPIASQTFIAQDFTAQAFIKEENLNSTSNILASDFAKPNQEALPNDSTKDTIKDIIKEESANNLAPPLENDSAKDAIDATEKSTSNKALATPVATTAFISIKENTNDSTKTFMSDFAKPNQEALPNDSTKDTIKDIIKEESANNLANDSANKLAKDAVKESISNKALATPIASQAFIKEENAIPLAKNSVKASAPLFENDSANSTCPPLSSKAFLKSGALMATTPIIAPLSKAPLALISYLESCTQNKKPVKIALLGENGAGKSTILNAIFLGARSCKKVAYLPQSEHIAWEVSVQNFIALGVAKEKRLYKDLVSKKVLSVAKLLKIEELLPRNILTLSGGEVQMCRLARTLIQSANLYLFDEAQSFLDSPNKILFEKILFEKNSSYSFISATHDILSAGRNYSHLALIMGENILIGESEKVFTSKNIKKAFGVDL